MKNAYPIILTPSEDGFVVYIPDFNINTQGKDVPDAMYMARDAIGIMGIDMEDDNEPLPIPSKFEDISCTSDDIKTLVDVDFDEYRKKNDNRAVKKTLSIPSWLNESAISQNINFSAVLQDALKEKLGVQ